jgi:hypothetical protein
MPVGYCALRPWGVEENYKREKLRLEIENFSSRTPRTLLQDFHAKIIALNLAVVMEWVAQAIAERVYEERQHPYQINFANALSVLKNALIRWMAKGMPWEGLLRLLTEIVGSVEPIKPGRSYPRIKRKVNVRQFHANYGITVTLYYLHWEYAKYQGRIFIKITMRGRSNSQCKPS